MLTITDLSLSLGQRPILRNLNLSLAAGEILGLVGESGSGKSMTALSILGLLPENARLQGQIDLSGVNLLKASPRTLLSLRGAHVGIVFQEPMTALNPVKTIGDQVAEPFRLHRGLSRRAARQQARLVLDRVGLPAERFGLDLYPHQLSGGQRQRVAIAMAIALKPRLLIADEATTALDVTTQAQILDVLKRLVAEDQMGLILITHDLAIVAETAHRVMVMKQGVVVEEGTTQQILSRMRHPYTQRLMADATHVPERRPVIDRQAPPILEVQEIIRDYPGQKRLFGTSRPLRAVDRVSLSLQPGESLGLVGESGCGKSTLLRTLLALDTPQSGRVLVRGRDITMARGRALKAIRRDIQGVFQDPFSSFNPRWTVADLVAENFHLLEQPLTSAEARYRIDQMLDQVGLPSMAADRYPYEFSGGQRQRIAIARALITHPAILCLDEAVSALDVTIRAQILDLLADLSERLGLAYLFVSHDLTVVRSVTDRVMIMQAGRIVEQGDTATVFADPKHAYSQQLLAATPDLVRNLSALNGCLQENV